MSRRRWDRSVRSSGERSSPFKCVWISRSPLNRVEAAPFLKAALERNPVSVAAAQACSEADLAGRVRGLADESIYDGPGRLAQPDEVWNFGRGDGLEKALLLANLWAARRPDDPIRLHVEPERAVLKLGRIEQFFSSAKGLREQEWTLR